MSVPARPMPLESKRPPDVPHPALGPEGLDKLEASLNALSRQAAVQSFSYLLLWFYFMFTVVNVTDLDLLLENPIKLPVFNLEIGLKAFFIGAPVLFWLVQLYMVRNVSLIADAAQCYLDVVARQAGEVPEGKRGAFLRVMSRRLDGFVVTRQATRFDRLADGPRLSILSRSLTTLAAAATLAVMPLALYFGFELSFLGYQDEFITWWHRGWLVAGLLLSAAGARRAGLTWWEATLGLLGLFVGLIGWLFTFAHRWRLPWSAWSMPAAWTRFVTRVRKPAGTVFRFFGWAVSFTITAGTCAAILAFAGLVATFPGEYMTETVLEDWPEVNEVVGKVGLRRTLSPKAPPGEWKEPEGGWKEAGPAPLDLRHRDFSGRSLRGISLVGSQLDSAVFIGARLDNAKLQGARLSKANLYRAYVQGADLTKANLTGADISHSRAQCSIFQMADFGGATISHANFQGSDFNFAHLLGADLSYTDFRGAAFGMAQLHGANISNARLQGIAGSGMRLDGANMSNASFWGALHWATAYIQANIGNSTSGNEAEVGAVYAEAVQLSLGSDGDIELWIAEAPLTCRNKVRDTLAVIARNYLNPGPYSYTDSIFETKIIEESRSTTIEHRSNIVAEEMCKNEGNALSIVNIVRRHSPLVYLYAVGMVEIERTYSSITRWAGGLSAVTLSEWFNDLRRCPAAARLDSDTKGNLARWRAIEEKLDPTGELRKKPTGEILRAETPP